MAEAPASAGLWPVVAKIVIVGLVDAIAVYALFVLVTQQQWLIAAVVAVVAALVNWIYFSRKKLPAKYLTPGLLFLALFQVFVLLYTGYIAMTNSGTGHNGSQEQAVASLMSSALAARRGLADLPRSRSSSGSDELNMLVTEPDGDALLGNTGTPLHEVDATFDDGKAVATDGYTTLTFQQVIARTDEIVELIVPVSDDPNDGALRTTDGSNAYLYISSLEYDEAAGTMTDLNTGTVYTDIGTGAFTAENGEELLPGWQIFVGLDNFVRAFTEESIRGPLVYVTIWTFAFAIISVASTFFLGLFLAIVFNDARMRGRKWYRVGDDPAVRLPRLPVGADLGGHDEPELRLHQPGALRRRIHPVADGSRRSRSSRCCSSTCGSASPTCSWSARARCSRSPRSSPRRRRSTARSRGRSSASSSCRCCS